MQKTPLLLAFEKTIKFASYLLIIYCKRLKREIFRVLFLGREFFEDLMGEPLRIVVAKPGLDGHDRGAKVVARTLRDAGHEVIYTGLRRTAQQIIDTVRDEDARFLGLSSLSGAHNHLFPRVCELLIEQGLEDVIVFGGGIIPFEDREDLYACGIKAIFGPGTPTAEILQFIEQATEVSDAGVGQNGSWRWDSSA